MSVSEQSDVEAKKAEEKGETAEAKEVKPVESALEEKPAEAVAEDKPLQEGKAEASKPTKQEVKADHVESADEVSTSKKEVKE